MKIKNHLDSKIENLRDYINNDSDELSYDVLQDLYNLTGGMPGDNNDPDIEDLIKRFGKKTNTYGLLNTSFNLHGFPIVNDAKDVFKIFEKSNLDALIINNDLYIKPSL